MWIKNGYYKWEWTYKSKIIIITLDKCEVFGILNSWKQLKSKAKKLKQCLGSKTSLEL